MRRLKLIILLFIITKSIGQVTISSQSSQPVVSINSKSLGLLLPKSNAAQVKAEDGLLYFNSNPNNPHQNDGLEFISSNSNNNGYVSSEFSDEIKPNFFKKDLSFPGGDTSNFFRLNGIDHFNKFNLYTKHYINDLPDANPIGHRPWTVSVTFKPLENETINPLWFFGTSTSTKGIILYLQDNQLKFRYGFENNVFNGESCENNPADDNAHSINFESTKLFEPDNWYTITVQFIPTYTEENGVKRDLLPLTNEQFLIFENTEDNIDSLEGNWSTYNYGEAENCAYNLEGNFYIGYGKETNETYFKGSIKSLHYSNEIISQDYLNAYATDGLKWWFNRKNQEGFHPDNHHFWLMGNGDQDTNIKIYNAVKTEDPKFFELVN